VSLIRRRHHVPDVLALIDAHERGVGTIPRSELARRCQSSVNLAGTKADSDRAREIYARHGFHTVPAEKWQRRAAAAAEWQRRVFPSIRRDIGAMEPSDLPPHLLPSAILRAVNLWAVGSLGGRPPEEFAPAVARAITRFRERLDDGTPWNGGEILIDRDWKALAEHPLGSVYATHR
jgi:hypothetical protein